MQVFCFLICEYYCSVDMIYVYTPLYLYEKHDVKYMYI